jgi:predicted secreted protein
MFCRKIICSLALILFFGLAGLWAGDTATFVDLGFSPDGRIFVFAQYGVQSGTLRPWADLFVVDVERNNFVSGGRVSYVHDHPVLSGQDGQGALHQIIARNAGLSERHRVNHCFQGRPLYIAGDDSFVQAAEFRDFASGDSYRAVLVQQHEGSDANLRSSFHISIERTLRDGSRRTYTVGTPQLRRPLISSYRIREVIVSPNGASMILVIEMIRQEGANTDIRYMVEALRL